MTVRTWSSPSPKQSSFSHCLSSTRKEGNGRYFEEITEALGDGGWGGREGGKRKEARKHTGQGGTEKGKKGGRKDGGVAGGRQRLQEWGEHVTFCIVELLSKRRAYFIIS